MEFLSCFAGLRASQADYLEQGKGDLFESARRAMHDPEFTQMTTEYKSNAGMWAIEKVLLLEQVAETLEDAAKPGNKQAIKEELETIPWLAAAATDARKKYVQTFLQRVEKRKAVAVSVPSGVEARRAKLRKITEAAAAKLKAEAAEKEKKALEKQQQLVKDAAVEFLRHEYGGKKEKLAPESVQEKLRKACRCHLTMMPGLHKDSVLSTLSICV